MSEQVSEHRHYFVKVPAAEAASKFYYRCECNAKADRFGRIYLQAS